MPKDKIAPEITMTVDLGNDLDSTIVVELQNYAHLFMDVVETGDYERADLSPFFDRIKQAIAKRDEQLIKILKSNPIVALDIHGRRKLLDKPMLYIEDIDKAFEKLAETKEADNGSS